MLDQKTGLKLIHKTIAIVIALFIAITVLLFVIFVYVQYRENTVQKAKISENEAGLASYEAENIYDSLSGRLADVNFLAFSFNYTMDSDKDTALQRIEDNWIAFSDSSKLYSKLRYIDMSGNEIIKINYSSNGSYATVFDKLQNKKDRYYFQNTVGLKKNQIYISKLDLSIENGLVEVPNKPVLRLSAPLYDKAGDEYGIMVLTYDASNMLDDFNNLAKSSDGSMFLLNDDGFWLANHSDTKKEWAFMYPGMETVSFRNEHPAEWAQMLKSDQGSFVTGDGLYTYAHISPYSSGLSSTNNAHGNNVLAGEGDWIIVSFVPNGAENGVVFTSNLYLVALFAFYSHKLSILLILLFSIFVSALIGAVIHTKAKIKNFSYDKLTGVYNKRAGYELLYKTYGLAAKRGEKLSICYVDIDGLKTVNDSFGHEAGDALIKSVVDAMRSGIRNSDFMIRIGGDEFLLVFVNADFMISECMWQRILTAFQRINDSQEVQFVVSASHGIEEFQFQKDEHIEHVIHAADAKMYEEKKNQKANPGT